MVTTFPSSPRPPDALSSCALSSPACTKGPLSPGLLASKSQAHLVSWLPASRKLESYAVHLSCDSLLSFHETPRELIGVLIATRSLREKLKLPHELMIN